MLPPPYLPTLPDLRARIDDVSFWTPYVEQIASRHGLVDGAAEIVAGHNATYPTFVYGDTVVKMFGSALPWRAAFESERAALELVGTDPHILAPLLLGAGQLAVEPDGAMTAWPYLVMTRVPGRPVWQADLDAEQLASVAAQMGALLRRLHALEPSDGLATDDGWGHIDVAMAARRSSLPDHLARQADGFVARNPPRGRVVVHGDIIENHVYVDGARIVGVIDWGDTVVSDPHYELAQIHRDLFDCDRKLLRVCLDAAGWPVQMDFASHALAMALVRQAVGLAQHHSMDVFEPVAARLSLADIATLDELATELFGL